MASRYLFEQHVDFTGTVESLTRFTVTYANRADILGVMGGHRVASPRFAAPTSAFCFAPLERENGMEERTDSEAHRVGCCVYTEPAGEPKIEVPAKKGRMERI
jgi:hypothetical protein